MNNQKLHGLFQQLAQQQDAQTKADLWPAIYHSLVQAEPNIQGANKMKTQKNRRLTQVWAGAGITLALVLTFFTATPVGRAWAQNIIHFFTPAESNSLQAATETPAPLVAVQPNAPAAPMAAAPADCNESAFPICTLDEIKGKVPFSIIYPAELPEGYKFAGSKTTLDGVLLAFNSPKGSYFLYESPLEQEGVTSLPVGKAAEIIATTVNGKQAEYVEGSWMGSPQQDGSVPWSEDDYLRTLAWSDGQLAYRLVSACAKVYESARPSVEDMVALAASVSPAAALPVVQQEGMTLAEAEKQAGFDFIEPDFIPPGMLPNNVSYNPANAVICRYYKDVIGTTGNSLVVAESEAALWSPYDFKKGKVDNGSGKMIEITMYVDHVNMPGVLNDKAIYMNNGIILGKLCGGSEDYANHGIIWQKGGRSFYIFGTFDVFMGHPYITRMELEQMAIQMSGLPAKEKQIDPERVRSLMDAEILWEGKVPFPSKMLSGMSFDHINIYDPLDTGEDDKALVALFIRKPVAELMTIYILTNTTATLDVQRTKGTEDVEVWGLPAVYHNNCYLRLDTGKDHCGGRLMWIADQTWYEMDFGSDIPFTREQIIEIAESMKP